MMTLSIHLNFDGSCAEALKFYESRLGGKIAFQMTWGESPMAATLPADWAKKIIHATFDVNGRTFSAADAPPGQYQRPQGFSVALDVAAPEEADRLYKALAEGGSVQMAIGETFWARRFGMLVDKFGIPWMINCGKPR
jgi:PhnB protein